MKTNWKRVISIILLGAILMSFALFAAGCAATTMDGVEKEVTKNTDNAFKSAFRMAAPFLFWGGLAVIAVGIGMILADSAHNLFKGGALAFLGVFCLVISFVAKALK